MTTFHDLFRQPTRAVNGSFPDDRRGELFPNLVERSRKLHLWTPGQPISQRGLRLLIGIATWSGYDLNLLDLVEDAVHSPVRIDVFDTGSCLTIDDFRRFVPDTELGNSTPVVGLWDNGRLVESGWGESGRQIVIRVCNIDPTDVVSRMKTILQRH